MPNPLWMEALPESVMPQENNSPLSLYIDFYNFEFFLDINSLVDQIINACTQSY